MMAPERIDLIERDLQAHARILTELTQTIADLKTDKAVREERNKHLEERLERIEHGIESFQRLGRWVLTTFGAILIAMVAQFIFKGGLIVQ